MLAGGNFGVGTFSRLDGEMIVLGGKIYQALADGTVRTADIEGTTPFAAVTFFNEDGRIENLAAATLDDLDEQLDGKLPSRNAPCAIRIDGEFTQLTLRSVPAQMRPFQPLVEVVNTPGYLAASQRTRCARPSSLPGVRRDTQRLGLITATF